MEMRKVLVTPSLAKELLEKNTMNRRVNDVALNQYYRDMLEGKWKENTGESIKISKSNIILDGQHRLMAVAKANIPIYFHIIENLDDSVFDVIDTGKSRSSSDVFKIKGIKNDTTIPSIINRYTALSRSKCELDMRNELITNRQLLDIYYRRESFWQNVAKKTSNWYGQFAKILSPSQMGGMYACFYDISSKDAEDFMNQLATGNDIKNPVIINLRNKLINDKLSVRKMGKELKMAIIIKTWNFYRKNETPKILKWDSTIENFPKAI